jgi:hypothetical protein
MTQPNGGHAEPTPLQQQLVAAGREMAATLAEFGHRVAATAALGQILAGLPDAARGMLSGLPAEHLRRIGGAAQALDEMAFNLTPEGKEVLADQAARTPADARGAVYAGIYGAVLRDDLPRANSRLDAIPATTLYELRDAAKQLITMIDDRLPGDGTDRT